MTVLMSYKEYSSSNRYGVNSYTGFVLLSNDFLSSNLTYTPNTTNKHGKLKFEYTVFNLLS